MFIIFDKFQHFLKKSRKIPVIFVENLLNKSLKKFLIFSTGTIKTINKYNKYLIFYKSGL